MIVEDFQENYGTGWIKLYRSVKTHWIFPKGKPLTNLEAWLLILLEVNHSPQKIQLGYDIIECKRGESINSLDTWSKMFHWHKSKVRRFFKLLEKDSMIVLNVCQKTTHLTVCNYETYQGERTKSETEVKRKRNGSETDATPNKNVKKEKNDKNNSLDFYQNQILSLNGEKYLKEYQMIFDYISGKNDLERPLDEILEFPNQLTYNQFEKLFEKSKKKEFSFKETLMTITNKKEYWKGKTSLYLTINGWINRSNDKK